MESCICSTIYPFLQGSCELCNNTAACSWTWLWMGFSHFVYICSSSFPIWRSANADVEHHFTTLLYSHSFSSFIKNKTLYTTMHIPLVIRSTRLRLVLQSQCNGIFFVVPTVLTKHFMNNIQSFHQDYDSGNRCHFSMLWAPQIKM